MKKYSVILIVGIILFIGSCGSNKVVTPDADFLIGTWEYSDTYCVYTSKIDQNSDHSGNALTFVKDGTGVLTLGNDETHDLAVVLEASFLWSVTDRKIVITFLDRNFGSIYSLEEFSDMHSGPFHVNGSVFTLFENESSSSCWSHWNRCCDN